MPVTINKPVPDFEMEVFYKNKIKKIKLSDYKKKWLVMLFYPKDFTFVCPTELESAAEFYNEFKKIGTEIMSVSTDTVYVLLDRALSDVLELSRSLNAV